MDPLPTGTLTLLFSDIEGSTALLNRLGERYGEALSAQRRILRAVFAEHGGIEMGTEGDSFFVVFPAAPEALSACVEAQRNLATGDWPDGVEVRVRMGLHTGEPRRHEDGYVGIDVHRAARIAATAHGGQVVVSEPTYQLLAVSPPAGVGMRDLGWHRLKDIEQPEHIFQVTGPGLRERFPPLKSVGAQSSLPTPATPLVGRDSELAELRDSVLRPGVRLLTLTGPGGVGKTRLGIALAAALKDTFEHGVFFVPLATVTNADAMWKAVADTVEASSDRPAQDAVSEHLAARKALLVLDNLEQSAEAPDVIGRLLAAAPRIVVVATSRRPMHLQGEEEYPVPPLAAPSGSAPEEVAASPAGTLFVQQAALVRHGFQVTPDNAPAIAAICRRLDGLPLAIELAAARAKLLPPKALLARLDDSLDLAANDLGRPGRQQTLRATIAWSHDLLTPEQGRVFRRLGVFEGGCDLDAVAAVAGHPDEPALDPLRAVSELLDLSLVSVTESADGEPRVGMLQTIREYAVEELARAGETETAKRRHADYCADFAERADAQLRGLSQLTWLDRLESENDNLRAALAWSLSPNSTGGEAQARTALGLRLVNALSWFWYGHGHAADGRRWLERAIDLASDADGPELVRAVHGLGVLLLQQGEPERARAALQQNLAGWRRLGDRTGLAKGLNSLGVTYRMLKRFDLARDALEESVALAREIADQGRLSIALSNLGIVEVDSGDPKRAMSVLRESLAIDRRLGNAWAVATVQCNLASAMIRAGRAADARPLLCSVVDEVVGYGDIELTADILERFATAAADLGAESKAAQLAAAAERLRREAGIPLAAPDADILERSLGPARDGIGNEAWEHAWALGLALDEPGAVDLAKQPLG